MIGISAWALLACTEPPVLDAVVDALGARVVDEAEPAIGMSVGVSGMVAEACGADAFDGFVFDGEAASAIGGAGPAVETSGEGLDQLVFDGIGLGDDVGTMVWTVDATRSRFSIAWVGTRSGLSGDIDVERCATQPAEALLSGTLTHDVGGDARTVALVSEAALGGLLWEPPTAIAPSGGQLRWARASEGEILLLDDASGIADSVWLGDATGPDWSARVGIETL